MPPIPTPTLSQDACASSGKCIYIWDNNMLCLLSKLIINWGKLIIIYGDFLVYYSVLILLLTMLSKADFSTRW